MGGGPVKDEVLGAVWPAAEPADAAVLYGHAELTPTGAFEARSLQTFHLTYTAGRHGLDDTGAIRVVFRVFGDWGELQTHDPTAANYTTVSASNGNPLRLEYRGRGGQRPFFKSLEVAVRGGFIREGDTITIVFGDTSGGGPGMAMQTFVESGFEFKVLADVCATGHFVPIPNTPSISIVPGPPHLWRAVLPTLRRPGERFHLGIKAEDLWGNPTPRARARLRLEADLTVDGLPEWIEHGPERRATTIEPLSVAATGRLVVRLLDETGGLVAETNPLRIEDGPVSGYWADLHGQSGESIGINTSWEYYTFGREASFLDACSHQANDFQINNAFWRQLNELSADFHEDGRFVTFPGYEWSGNTGVGGDRNVYFRAEGRQIHRSSHALLPDRSDIGTDAPTAAALFEALDGEDAVVYAHVGGRYADVAYAHDGRFETSMEIHSAWGTFEWLIEDCFDLGHRVGVVCNSDGHKGRPGASYPGAATFGAYGGLTCFLTDRLDRDAIFEALRRRHHYGTTGNRLHLDVRAEFAQGGTLFERDPKIHEAAGCPVDEAIMGDIVQTAGPARLRIRADGGAAIERIDVLNGRELVTTLRGHGTDDLGARIRVIWSGAEYRGRGRQSTWRGTARFQNCRIRRMAKINAWNHERRLEVYGHDLVTLEAITTGNFGGFDVWLEEGAVARLQLSGNHVGTDTALADIGLEDLVLDAGGLGRRMRIFRLPEVMAGGGLSSEVEVPLRDHGDNPLWVRVTTEDGFQAWSSPIYVFR